MNNASNTDQFDPVKYSEDEIIQYIEAKPKNVRMIARRLGNFTPKIAKALAKADPLIVQFLPLKYQTQDMVNDAIDIDPSVVLHLHNPSKESIRKAVYRVKELNDNKPGLNVRSVVANFINCVNRFCPEPELYRTLMEINTYPWQMIPAKYIDVDVAVRIVLNEPHNIEKFLEIDVGISASSLANKALRNAIDGLDVYHILEHVSAKKGIVNDELVEWVLENAHRRHYPDSFVEILERDYKRDYGVKKLKEPE